MNVREHKNRDDLKVWLSQEEVELLLDAAENTQERIAYGLGAKVGLRSHEIIQVTPNDVVETDVGPMLVVREGKGGKYREAPIPSDLKTTIETVADVRDSPQDEPIIETNHTRTLRRWIERARKQLADECGDSRWNNLTFHDLRATYATQLKSSDVDALVVCDWGGWDDLETFLDHYRGTHTPEAQRREREKVNWL